MAFLAGYHGLGSDTVPALPFIVRHYQGEMQDANAPIMLSVPASEHSVMCSFGREDELAAFRHMLATYPSGIVSIVSDTFNIYRVLTEFAEILKPTILARPAGSKVVDRPKAAALADRLREAGRKIVFTNGCFDVLHAGHARYLAFAKEQGDALIVGLNADESVTRLKGPGRPVNDAADRAEVLSALSAVDHVVVFHEDDPRALIEEIRPDVLVKGEDWRDKGVVGREFVEARGGRVVLAPLLPGRSTTSILKRSAKPAPNGPAERGKR